MNAAPGFDPPDMIVPLPGGLLLDDGGMIDRVGLRRLSGREEDWLARHPTVTNAETISSLLAACLALETPVLPERDFARHLLVGDRDFLILKLRELTFGSRISAVYRCPVCQERMDVSLDLAEAPVRIAPQTTRHHPFTLEDGRDIMFRLPSGVDQEAVARLPPDDASRALLHRCLLADDEVTVSARDEQVLADAIEERSPEVHIELDLVCPECDHAFSAEFDCADFFIAELAVSQRTLLREVHHLAFHYGWSEDAILGLDRLRRRDYLSLLSDELRPD